MTVDADEYRERAKDLERRADAGLAPGVYLYEHINFEGEVRHVTQDVPNLGEWWNDRVSSWRVVGDYSVVGFEHAGFVGGRSYLPSGGACTDMEPFSTGVITRGCRGEVRNDMMSSVGVGTAAFNRYLEPLCWPKTDWIYTTGTAGATYGFHFYPDYTYRLNELSIIGSVTTTGTWRATVFDPWIPVFAQNIVTRNNTSVVAGNPLPVPAPDADYRYRFQGGGNVVEILFRGTWLAFS
jgi:hypothetical protein